MDHLKVLVPPTFEPITLQEAKVYLRVDQDTQDDLITSLIKAARIQCELRLKQAIPQTTYEWNIAAFPMNSGYFNREIREMGPGPNWLPGTGSTPIRLPKPPLISVDDVQYRLTDGTMAVLAPSSYVVSTGFGAAIAPAYNLMWPIVGWSPEIGNVVIQFTSGYAIATEIPENLKVAMMMLVDHWYEFRGPVMAGTTVAEVPYTVDAILNTLSHGSYS